MQNIKKIYNIIRRLSNKDIDEITEAKSPTVVGSFKIMQENLSKYSAPKQLKLRIEGAKSFEIYNPYFNDYIKDFRVDYGCSSFKLECYKIHKLNEDLVLNPNKNYILTLEEA